MSRKVIIKPSTYRACLGSGALFFSRKSSDKGPDSPTEDTIGYKLYPCGSLILCLADGMGGHNNGNVASRMAVQSVLSVRSRPSLEKILDKIQSAHTKISNQQDSSGTTLVCALISGNHLNVVNIGDSRLMLFGLDGLEKISTWEHSVTGFAQEAGIIDEQEAQRHDESHLLLNALGIDSYRAEILRNMKIAQGETVLLGSDGFTANLTRDEISTLASQSLDQLPASVCRAVDKKIEKGGHPDDLSLIIYHH